MAVGAVSAISGSSRQIIWKVWEPVSDGIRPEPGWHTHHRSQRLPACLGHFISAVYKNSGKGVTNYTDHDVDVGQTYRYRVSSINGVGIGPSSPAAFTTIR